MEKGPEQLEEQRKQERKQFLDRVDENSEQISEQEFIEFTDKSVELANREKKTFYGFFNNFHVKMKVSFSGGTWGLYNTEDPKNKEKDRYMGLPSGKKVSHSEFFKDIKQAATDIDLDTNDFLRIYRLERAFFHFPQMTEEDIQKLVQSNIMQPDDPGIDLCQSGMDFMEKCHDPRFDEFNDKYTLDFNKLRRDMEIMQFKMYKRLRGKGYSLYDLSI